jgi:hypothetical protein
VIPDRLDGGALVAARSIWLFVCGGTVTLALIGFVRAFIDPMLIALPPLTDLLAALGLNFRVMMAVSLALPLTVVVAVSAVVFWRRSHDPMALIFTGALILLFTFSSRTLLTFADDPVLHHAVSVVFGLCAVALAVVLALFPNGRSVPHAARWLVVGAAGLVIAVPDGGHLMMILVDGEQQPNWRARAFAAGWFAIILVGLAAQAYRYRRVSTPTERQQTKWVMAPLGIVFVAFTVVAIAASAVTGPRPWYGWVLLAIIPLGIVFPVMLANAVLRYRLYAIDRVVSRTVSYALVVATLTGVYAVGVLALGALTASVTGAERTELAVAGSTLAVIALFRPLRARARHAVDRRFNRTGYAAHVAVESFAHRLRDDVDLDAIDARLTSIARAAMQPSRVSLWMVSSPEGERPDPTAAAS